MYIVVKYTAKISELKSYEKSSRTKKERLHLKTLILDDMTAMNIPYISI